MSKSVSTLVSVLILLWFSSISCSSQATSGEISGMQMAAANQLYEEGNFVEAAVRYESLVGAGAEDGRLYYNLGGAYFKMGDLGRAVLNLRRAQRLLPRDGDVATNLRLARAQTRDRIELENEGAIVNLIRRIIYWTAPEEAAIATLVLWVFLCAVVVGAILLRQRRRGLLFLAGGITVVLLLGLLSLAVRLLDERGNPPAVVIAGEVAVRSGPGNDYLTEFSIHAGAEVRVVERRGSWLRIALPGDLQGWAPDAAVIAVSSRD